MKKSLLVITILIGFVGYFVFTNIYKKPCYINLNNQRFDLSVAQTEAERAQGLSGTASLAQNTGKFFVFERTDMYGFWMKDMNYAIDIIWFDGDLKIVDIAQNTTPETYPKVFYPNQNALYTLEIMAGEAEKLNLGFGQSAQLHCQAVLK